jgi:hypothetical protein
LTIINFLLAAGTLLLEYTASNSFGIVIAKSHDNVVAAVVDSGETLLVFPSTSGSVEE